MYCGGKGINVSNVLANLGIDSVGFGFIAGFTGDAIETGQNSWDLSRTLSVSEKA